MNRPGLLRIFLVYLRLGFTAFGGPVAHLVLFHREFVLKRSWISDKTYAHVLALSQVLPGPSSSQLGMSIGFYLRSFPGALAAWLGFTLPSAVILTFFAKTINRYPKIIDQNWIHGLKVAAFVVVADAVWKMGQKLCPDLKGRTIAVLCAAVASFSVTGVGQIAAILLGATVGLLWTNKSSVLPDMPEGAFPIRKRTGFVLLVLFFTLLMAGLFFITGKGPTVLKIFSSFYRSGALVFGGGHVVLPLLEAELVGQHWMSKETFMAGYGAVQALPGPLFSVAAYLGASITSPHHALWGAGLALIAIFLPSFLLILGILPFWHRLIQHRWVARGLPGIHAAVVGLLLAALYNPIGVSALLGITDWILVPLLLVMNFRLKPPPWSIVAVSVIIYQLLGFMGIQA